MPHATHSDVDGHETPYTAGEVWLSDADGVSTSFQVARPPVGSVETSRPSALPATQRPDDGQEIPSSGLPLSM